MTRGKVFECEITISPGVKEKLLRKHSIGIWEIEEVIYEDQYAFSISYQDCYFIYGQTFAGRYLLVLVRVLSREEIAKMHFPPRTNMIKIITARDMNAKQRKLYIKKRGAKK